VGPLGGKWRQLVGKVREWYVASWHLQGCSPRLCRFRIDGLSPMSKYWTYRSPASIYGPRKLSSWSSTGGWLTPTASLASSGEKLGTDRRSVSWRAMDCGIRPNLSASHKKLRYVDHVRYVWYWTIRELNLKTMWHFGQVVTCRVYTDSYHRDTQIWVTTGLWQSSHR
jgi:hypothetical protein